MKMRTDFAMFWASCQQHHLRHTEKVIMLNALSDRTEGAFSSICKDKLLNKQTQMLQNYILQRSVSVCNTA
jgi:hypothetical protein